MMCDLGSAFRHSGGTTYNIFQFFAGPLYFCAHQFSSWFTRRGGCLYTGTEKPRHFRYPSSVVRENRHHGGRRAEDRCDEESVPDVRHDEERLYRHPEDLDDTEHHGPAVRRRGAERYDQGNRLRRHWESELRRFLQDRRPIPGRGGRRGDAGRAEGGLPLVRSRGERIHHHGYIEGDPRCSRRQAHQRGSRRYNR